MKKSDTKENMTVIDSDNPMPTVGAAVSDLSQHLGHIVDVIRQQPSPFVMGMQILEAKQRFGKGVVKFVADQTQRPYATLAQYVQVADGLGEMRDKILDTRLAHQVRCLLLLARLANKAPELAARAIEMILDDKHPQNTAESALARLQAMDVANDVEDAAQVGIEIESEEANANAFKAIRNDPEATPVQRLIGHYLSAKPEEQVEFLKWLDEHLPQGEAVL